MVHAVLRLLDIWRCYYLPNHSFFKFSKDYQYLNITPNYSFKKLFLHEQLNLRWNAFFFDSDTIMNYILVLIIYWTYQELGVISNVAIIVLLCCIFYNYLTYFHAYKRSFTDMRGSL